MRVNYDQKKRTKYIRSIKKNEQLVKRHKREKKYNNNKITLREQPPKEKILERVHTNLLTEAPSSGKFGYTSYNTTHR